MEKQNEKENSKPLSEHLESDMNQENLIPMHRDYPSIHIACLAALPMIKFNLSLIGHTLTSCSKLILCRVLDDLKIPEHKDYRSIVYDILRRYSDPNFSNTMGSKKEPYFEKEDIYPPSYCYDTLSDSEKEIFISLTKD